MGAALSALKTLKTLKTTTRTKNLTKVKGYFTKRRFFVVSFKKTKDEERKNGIVTPIEAV